MQKDFNDSKTKSLSVNDTMNEYFAAVFKIGIMLEMSAALSAAIAFTAMKALGFIRLSNGFRFLRLTSWTYFFGFSDFILCAILMTNETV